ncbi:MAG TPA: proton-conducting transporter membrane subunit [Gaiellaceae bacterium]|nr:proton-conducting transporter membrane subunit [Gaiellaceae bacterium]
MSWLLPLPVVIPLLGAAVNAALDHVTPRWLHDAVSLAAVVAAFGFAVAVLLSSMSSEPLHWFGGWTPRSGIAVGVGFAADPLGAGFAVLACGLTLASLVYSLAFVDASKRSYDILLCALCGALCGFTLTADLFNMFVWLELLGVACYALTGFYVRRTGALQGALNFAIVNTVGGYFVLLGIGLLYARTGALNLAQIGRTLAGEPAGGPAVIAMTLVFCGFLCKAAVVPFHFWLADAYAAAPAPVCLIFAGVVTDIGLFGVARVWFTVFDAPFGAQQRFVGDALLWVGIVTALVGGLMALVQSQLKRLLSFSVVCHIGIMLAGVGLLSSKGVAGAASMLLAHGLVTGALFLAAGVLAVREPLRWTSFLWFAGAIALIGPPYVGVYMGHALIDDAAVELGRQWVQPLLWLAGALAGAAILRAGAQVFLGLSKEDYDHGIAEREDAFVPLLVAIPTVLVVLGFAVGLVPGLTQRIVYGADRFRDRAAYANRVLHGLGVRHTAQIPLTLLHTSLESILYGCGALVVAVSLAAFAVLRPNEARTRVFEPVVWPLRRLQTGVIGDYVMWIVVGVAVIGGVWAVTLR